MKTCFTMNCVHIRKFRFASLFIVFKGWLYEEILSRLTLHCSTIWNLLNRDKISKFLKLQTNRADKSLVKFIMKIFSLSIEIYKFLDQLYLSIMGNVFKQNQSIPYELKNCNTFRGRRANSVKYGTETISYLAPKIWSVVPETIKSNKLLELFKLKIRK